MAFNKQQKIVLLGSFLVFVSFLSLYFTGFTKPLVKKGETGENEIKDVLTEDIVLSEARKNLDSTQLKFLSDLDKELSFAEDINKEISIYKLLSRTWFEYKNYLVSGFYAKKVAELSETADSWGIAGTTYGAAFTSSKKVDEKKLAAQLSISALEKAEVLDSSNIQHQLNKGLMYLELSTVDATVMPMTGIRMLQELEKKNPDNVMINMTLGRLSITRTGDLEKALPRFEKVLDIATSKEVPVEVLLEANYFLVECYKGQNNREKVIEHFDNAIELCDNESGIKEELISQKENFLNNNNKN